MTRMLRATTALAVALLVPATAFADKTSPAVGTYKFTGKLGDAAFSATLTVKLGNGDAALAVTCETPSKSDPTLDWQGLGKLAKNVLSVTPKGDGGIGIVRRLGGEASPETTRLEVVANFDSDKFDHATVSIDKVTTLNGKSSRTVLGTGELEETLDQQLKEQAGELLVLAKDKVRELTDKGVTGQRGIDLFGGYLHLGAEMGIRTLGADEESDAQKKADEAQAGKNPIWVETKADGGPIVAHTVSVPLNQAGTLSLEVGFQAMVNVAYTVQDQYTLQPDIVLQLARKELFAAKVPVDAPRALAMPLGSRRELEGTGSIATSGTLVFGAAFLEQLQTYTKDFAEFRADADVGVTFTVSGTYRVEVDRLEESLVHVHWTRVRDRDLSVEASAVIGLVANDDKINALKKPIPTVVHAIVDKAADYAVLKIDLSDDHSHERDLDVDMVIDLASAKGPEAYDRAIKGDLRTAHQLHHMKDGSIKSWSIASKLTDSVKTEASLSLFKLITLGASRENGHTYELVSTDKGAMATDTFTNHASASWLVRFFGGVEKNLDGTATARTVRALGSPTERGLHLSIDYTRHDNSTDQGDLNDRLSFVREFFSEAPAAPADRKKFGAVDTHLSAELGEKGLANILKASDDDFYASYGSAVWDQHYAWTPGRVQALHKVSLIMEKNETPAQYRIRAEAWRLYEADKVLKLVHEAQQSKTTNVGKARAFRDVIDKNALQLHAVIALVHLAGSEDAKVSVSVKGPSETFFEKTTGEASDLPVLPGAPSTGDGGSDGGGSDSGSGGDN